MPESSEGTVGGDGIELIKAQLAEPEQKAIADEVCGKIEIAHIGYLEDARYIYQQAFANT